MRAGRLRYRICIQAATVTKDSRGENVETWTTVLRPWADVRQPGGREMELALQVHAETQWLIEMRYVAGITSRHRIIHDGRTLDILAVTDPEQRKRMLIINAKEHTATGGEAGS